MSQAKTLLPLSLAESEVRIEALVVELLRLPLGASHIQVFFGPVQRNMTTSRIGFSELMRLSILCRIYAECAQNARISSRI